MTFKPWDCAQPDEWLPRSLRLCWGDSSDSGGGFGGTGFGDSGGWGDTGATTGGGDWGSAGSFNASSFNATGDVNAYAGTAYDASTFGTGMGGGGDWGSFGATHYSGLNAPNPIFTDIAGPNPGVTTGGGDWGSAGAFSAEGTGGGPGGALSFGSGGGGLYGGNTGGGLFGDYGSPGGFTGDSGYSGGGRGGGPFGGFTGSIGTLAASNTGRGSERSASETFSDTAGSAGGRGAGQASAGRITSDAPTRSEATIASVAPSPDDPDAPAPDAPAPDALGNPEPDAPAPEQAAPEQSAPEASRGDVQSQPTTSRGDRGADPEGIDPGSAQYGVFGPQSVAYQQATQQLSDLTQTGLQPDYQGAFAGPDVVGDRSSPYEGSFAGPDVVGNARGDPSYAGRGAWGDLPGIYTQGISNLNLDPRGWVDTPAWAQQVWDSGKSLADVSTWLSPLNQQTFNEIANLPSTLYNALNPSVPFMLQAPSTMDLQAQGEQGKAGQRSDPFDSRFGFDPNTDTTNWGAVFEGGPTSPDWGSVFEGATPSIDPRSSIEAFIPGGRETDFEYADPAPSIEAFIPGGRTTDFEYGGAPVGAAPPGDVPPGEQTTTDNAATPGSDPALSGYPAEGASGAPGTGGAAGAPADAASGRAQEGGGQPQSQGITLGQLQDAVYGTSGPYITSGGIVYGGLTPADIQAAVYGSSPPGMPAGNPNADLTDETSQPSANINPGRAESFIPGGRTTDFEYAGAPQAQPAPPSLIDMAQPGMQGSIPGGRTTDFNYPSSTSRGIEPGAEQYGVEGDQHNAPEPQDSSLPAGRDPNAPTPPGNIPGQLRGQNGSYQNPHADTPQTSRTYRDSGRTDYPQGQPGITFRTARQAGIQPLFRTEDINVEDTDARLVDNINRALQAMEQRTGIPASSLVATSGWRAAHRGEAAEHFMDPRTSQESVYSRGNPRSGNPFAAASPGHSNHGPGRAIDFSPRGESGRALAWLRANAREFDLETLGRNFDIPHIQLRGGGAGQRPSAQEQQAQRALDAQNRQAAIDAGLIGGGRTQVAGVPMPRGRPSDAPQAEVATGGIQPGAEQYAFTGQVPAAQLPAVNLPPQIDPVPRPQADIPIDIPVQTVPPGRGMPDPAMLAKTASQIAADMAAKGPRPTSQAEGQAALSALARALGQAGIPAAIASRTLMDIARAGAKQAGYDPDGIASSFITSMTGAAMQGFRTAPSHGEVQGPPAPADLVAPGKRSEAPGLLDFLGNFNPISTAEARGGRIQAGNLAAPRADPGIIQGRLSAARADIVNELQTNQGLRNTLDLIVTGEVGSQGRAAVLGFLETAMNKVSAEASREGRAPTGRDLLNYLNNRSYFPDTWGKIESGKVRGGALTDDLIGAIGAGSNTTQLSTGNSSASSQGSRFGGNPTNATIGKEHYGVENYGHHAAWYNAMGALPAGRGIGSDYAAGPYGQAVGAMPAQDAAPGMRGLAKGGRVDDNEPVVVGEQGPEVFVPDQSGTIWPHVPQPGLKSANVDRWPKLPAPDYPGRYGGVEREIKRQTRAAQDVVPSLMDMIDSGRLRLNAANWNRMINDPSLIALGRSRMEDRRAYSYDYPY